MKRKFLVFAMTLMAMTASAQIVVWNGEDKEVGSDGGFWNRADPTVVVEDGSKCLKIMPKANPGGWDQENHNAAIGIGDVNFSGLRRISLRIKMSDKENVEVQLEGKNGAFDIKRAAYYDTPNKWKTLVFEFGAGSGADKITDTNSHALAIWPYQETAAGEGKTIYIDDIMIEGTIVGGAPLSSMADESLTSQQVIVTGAVRKGECSDLNNSWEKVYYNDYDLLYDKMSADVCFLNLAGAIVTDGDGPRLRTKNPNLLILSPAAFFENDNVICWDEINTRNSTNKMVLSDAYPFYSSINFYAENVEVTRNLKAGINTLYLPFYVGEAEISTNCKIATYTSTSATDVTFTYANHADANVPFLATDVDADAEKLYFTEKGVVATPASSEGVFVGVYKPQSAKDLYGINNSGQFQKGGALATINSFRALLTSVPAAAHEVSFVEDETTAINSIKTTNGSQDAVYTLQGVRTNSISKGIYIINGKKVIVK